MWIEFHASRARLSPYRPEAQPRMEQSVMNPDFRTGTPGRPFVGGVSRRTAMAGLGALALSAFASAKASTWPSKPIRVLVGAQAGGLTDMFARRYGEFLAGQLGQPVVVENKPGVSGILAADYVAKSAPDGHTLAFVIHSAVWGGRVLYNKMPFDPDRDLVPVALFPGGPAVVAVNSKLPISTPEELLAYARTKRASMGTYSPGSWPHMIADTWSRKLGVEVLAVHYKGEAPMWMDVAAGHVTAGAGSYQALLPHIQTGAARPIAILGSYRCPGLPDVPTFEEYGMTDPILAVNGWLPLCAPAGTPPDVIQRIAQGMQDAYKSPKVQEFHKTVGIPNGPTDLAETQRRWREDAPVWIRMSEQLGLKLD